ncbi:hypothetical protein BDM02DRAFT_3096423 [Thelephora ganbajun]|uniref:Uncharacterized protein n=1 Tax=Thelephora ganbajun TaxID=370292 RepID=A0ACB6ZGI5_THEGA|nr:hypothetical protein BDM02DRAFT_3096423 [Thelephora ganbajun]
MSLENTTVLVFGGSRNIGYLSSLRLLGHGATVVFLLRNPKTFDDDAVIKPYLDSGKAIVVNGDALSADDVASAWKKAAQVTGRVDFVIFSVGGTPKITLTHGAVIEPRNLCTQSTLNVLCDMPHLEQEPKFIFVSSTGLTKASHEHLPILLKPLYSWLLKPPHVDKLGLERILHHAAGKPWADPEPEADIMNGGVGGGVEWQSRPGLPAAGSLNDWIIVRPALLTSGKCEADKTDKKGKPYKIIEGDSYKGYTISRADVAHFIAEEAILHWDQWKGKILAVGY